MSDPATPTTRLEALIAFALRRRIVRAFLRYQDAGGPMLADSVTYRALFSLFAGVFLGFSIAAIWLLAHPQAFEALVTTLERLVPGLIGAGGAIDPDELLAPVAFTIAGAFASLGLVGAALGAVGSMRSALRQISAARTEPTLFVWEILQKLWVAALVGLAFVLAAALSVFGSSALGWLLGRVGVGDIEIVSYGTDLLSMLVILGVDVLIVALLLGVLSGVRASRRALWASALLGGLALTALQLLSRLVVGGSLGNPLLASFASLITLLLWLNLSSQAILLAGAWFVTSAEEEHDRVRARFGAQSFGLRRVQRAEDAVSAATAELHAAHVALEAEHRGGGAPARGRDAQASGDGVRRQRRARDGSYVGEPARGAGASDS